MLDAMKRQAGRPGKNNLRPVGTNLTGQRSDEILATEIGESARQIQRYICLTNLIPELLDLVDQKEYHSVRQLRFRILTVHSRKQYSIITKQKENWILMKTELETKSRLECHLHWHRQN